MENLKEEVKEAIKNFQSTLITNIDEDEGTSDITEISLYDLIGDDCENLTDKLIAIFDRERKRYAFNKCRETLSNVEKYIGNTFSIFELSELVPKDLLIPSELQTGVENEK